MKKFLDWIKDRVGGWWPEHGEPAAGTAAALLIICLSLSGCAQIADFTLKDAQAAKIRAQKAGDAAGERCWAHVETQMLQGAGEFEIAGIMDAIEAARVARLKAPQVRQELVAGCGEVFADVVIELARRAARRGL